MELFKLSQGNGPLSVTMCLESEQSRSFSPVTRIVSRTFAFNSPAEIERHYCPLCLSPRSEPKKKLFTFQLHCSFSPLEHNLQSRFEETPREALFFSRTIVQRASIYRLDQLFDVNARTTETPRFEFSK